MEEFQGKVAVVTGAASGIGRALANRCAQEGMKVVLADIEKDALADTESKMRSAGANVLAVLTDVSRGSDINRLAQETLNTFGAIHLLCNNAGVNSDESQGWNIWERTPDEWQWVIGVNLWSVIHGITTFVPIMLEQDTECHIVNTASVAGLLSPPYFGIYNVTKHGIVTLSETLHRELELRKTKIKVSVLCPAWVKTHLGSSARNRPAELGSVTVAKSLESGDEIQSRESYFNALYDRYGPDVGQRLQEVLEPESIAESVFQAITNDEFYVFTHPSWQQCIQNHCDDILKRRNPGIFL